MIFQNLQKRAREFQFQNQAFLSNKRTQKKNEIHQNIVHVCKHYLFSITNEFYFFKMIIVMNIVP
jgi:hypothetical protein